MARLAFRILLALTLLHGGLAAAESAADGRRIDELMHKSGLWKQIGQMQAQVKAGAAESRAEAKSGGGRGAMSDDDFARLEAAMTAAYAPDRLRSAFSRRLAEELSAKDEEEVLVWLSSDLGKRITRLEEDSGEVEAATQGEREAQPYLDSLPASRVARFQRFAELIHAGESGTTAFINITTAVVYGIALATPPFDTTAAEALRKRFEAQRPQMVAALTQQAVAQLAYTYKTLSDDEIDRYVGFVESAAGRNYHDATLKILDEVLTRASLDIGREFGRTTPDEPRRRS